MHVNDRIRHARMAVFVLFLTNGALFANLVPRYPEIKDIFELSDSLYGMTIATFPLGALIVGPLAGAIMRRLGSARTAAWGTIGVGLSLTGVGILAGLRLLTQDGASPGCVPLLLQALFMAVLFTAGGLDAITDVGQNGHGLRVQRVLGRPIINSFHAGWSIGAVIGGFMGTTATAAHIPLWLHLIVASTLFVIIAQVALRFCLPGADPLPGQRDPVSEWSAASSSSPIDLREDAPDLRIRTAQVSPVTVVTALTLLAIAGMLVEDAAQTWTTLYMRDYLMITGGLAGSAYVLALAAQTIGRFSADWQMQIFGPRRTLIYGGLLITLGMGIAVVVPTVWTTIIGMCLAGFGCASTVPIAMNAADDIPGMKPGVGLTIVSWLGRLAFLGAPPLVGIIVEHTSLLSAMVVVPIAGLLTLVSAQIIRGSRGPRVAKDQ
ncbi:MFS transporter [Schaalia sp. ZJ1691]|uniref:MFS transporter n=1 Tax=Schaalia sp. ZJ1691 TaxID=2709404 RepID=UPI0013ED445C|nr:MFS transporter [Schaalia sp. ZJ1691]